MERQQGSDSVISGGGIQSLSHSTHRIALYYCYVPVHKVDEHVEFQKGVCKSLNLNGRIRVSPEGLNGVLSGLLDDLKEYELQTQQNLLLDGPLDVKYCLLREDLTVQSQLFDSLSVKPTREVVSLYEPTPAERLRSEQPVNEGSKRYYRRRRRNRQKHEQHQSQASQQPDNDSNRSPPQSPHDARLTALEPSPHLTPAQWNDFLHSHPQDTILVDARNSYESRVGYFSVSGVPTLLTNTRKFSGLPQVLLSQQHQLQNRHILMYCTGGVRCERASVFLQSLDWKGTPPKSIHQLDGGIQRYLEQYNYNQNHTDDGEGDDSDGLFCGKNFVFDPRRTDPVVGKGIVGLCLVCQKEWDDYDNGASPSENKEARCCHCRVLILVCNDCRKTVETWGEERTEEADDDAAGDDNTKPQLFCGGDECISEGNSVQAEIVMAEDGHNRGPGGLRQHTTAAVL